MKKLILWIIAIIVALLITYFLVKKPIASNYNQKGVQSFILKEYSEAEGYFKRALAWHGNSSDVLINMIKLKLAEDKIEETNKYYEKLSKHHPNHAETFGLKGQILVLQKNFDESIILNTNKTVSEGNSTNIIIISKKVAIYPKSKFSLPGTMLKSVIRKLKRMNYKIICRNIFPSDLTSDGQVYAINSLIGIYPISKINKKNIPFDLSLSFFINKNLIDC